MLARGCWDVELRDAFSPRARRSGLADMALVLSNTILPRAYTQAWESGSMRALFAFTAWFPWVRLRINQIIQAEQPDVVICTHALPCAVLAKRERKFALLGVATDFQVHAYWPPRGVDGYAVASAPAAERMQKRGVPASKLRVLGIPVQPEFGCLQSSAKPPAGDSGPRRMLVITGGGRNAPYVPLYPKILRLLNLLAREPLDGVEWCFVFGRGDWLRLQAEKRLAGRADVTLLGLSGEMPMLMDWADLVVTKPGGLTLAEALALQKPVLLLQRGAGQEAANTQIVVESGAGMLVENAEAVLEAARRLTVDTSWVNALAGGVTRLARPAAAHEIAAWAEEMVNQ